MGVSEVRDREDSAGLVLRNRPRSLLQQESKRHADAEFIALRVQIRLASAAQ